MRRALPILLAVLALVACDDAPPPGRGSLTVSLRSPNAAEGAARIRLVGPGMLAVSAVEGEVHSRVRGDTLSVLVLRPDPGPLRFVIQVADTTRRPRGAVVQVVSGSNEVRPALQGYRVEVSR